MTDIKLLIFDMDGTLIDSAYLNYYSYSNDTAMLLESLI